MRTIVAQPLTAQAFAPYGEVLASPAGESGNSNQGTAVRRDRAAQLASSRPGCRPNLAMIRALPQALPLQLRLMERHPCSSQAFIPLRCGRYVVVVCRSSADGSPDWAGLEAFVAGAGQGINYAMGTWHHPFTALDQPAELAMLAWEDGGPNDCEELALPEAIRVVEP